MRWSQVMRFAALALIAGAVAGVIWWLTPLGAPFADRRFEREGWLQGSLRKRGAMAGDLEASGRLLGLRPAEVEELLGPPDYRREATLTYKVDLGHRMGFTPWLYYLDVEFGGDDLQVVQVSLRD